jgi:hypothetical protein
MEKIVVGHFLSGWPSSVPTPAHLQARARLPARYRAAIIDRRGSHVSSLFPQIPQQRPRVTGGTDFGCCHALSHHMEPAITAGQLLPRLCMPLGHPIPSLMSQDG